MKICRANAFRLWYECFGDVMYAEDFHGNLMCKEGYGNKNYHVDYQGQTVFCGWNLHHILPISNGGTNEKHNLICTNIYTNHQAGDKITYWIDDSLYQVQRIAKTKEYKIVKQI